VPLVLTKCDSTDCADCSLGSWPKIVEPADRIGDDHGNDSGCEESGLDAPSDLQARLDGGEARVDEAAHQARDGDP
jgi:hypothetical protein